MFLVEFAKRNLIAGDDADGGHMRASPCCMAHATLSCNISYTCFADKWGVLSICMTIRKGARIVIRRSSFSHPKSTVDAFVISHPFNSALQICLPRTTETTANSQVRESVGADVSADPVSTPYDLRTSEFSQDSVVHRISRLAYNLLRCNLAVLLDSEFLERHVRGLCAEFTALSVNTPIDRTDVAAILPGGQLVLSVTRDTYERLELVGKHAFHDKGIFQNMLS